MEKIVEIELYNQDIAIEKNKDFYLFYVLQGHVTIKVEQEPLQLKTSDILVVNPNQAIAVDCGGVFVQMKLQSNQLLKLMDYQKVLIICDSTKGDGPHFAKLRRLLDELIRGDFEEDDHYLYNLTKLFEFLAYLMTNFSNNLFIEDGEESRKNSIVAYIHGNYAKDLSLQTIADHFNVTPQYFSKYFKENFQVNFLKFLTNIRLEQSISDLIHTNHTMLKIALDHGFPNQHSFAKAFKQKFGMNPTDFRKMHFEGQRQPKNLAYDEVKQLLTHKTERSEDTVHLVQAELRTDQRPLEPFWFNLINLGPVSKLFDNNLNEQIVQLKLELPFKVARVFLDSSSWRKGNFFVEEKALDFLVNLGFVPMLVLDYRGISSNEHFEEYFAAFLNHFVNRYGIKTLRTIDFELLYNTRFTKIKAQSYAKLFASLSQLLGRFQLSERLVGPGLLMDNDGENLHIFLKENPQLKQLTINIAPYSIEKAGNKLYINRKPDANYIVQQYQLAKQISQDYGLSNVKITSWKDALNEVTSTNDSAYRGANIMKNMLAAYGKLHDLPIEQPFDLMSQAQSNKPLSGLPGILSKDSVKKPAYFSFLFLKKLDQSFLYKDDTLLISNSGDRYLQIVCHNCKQLNYKFYNQEKQGVLSDQLEDLFEDNQVKQIKLQITGIANGNYFLKSREISEQQGSCLQVVESMGFEQYSFFGRDELEYLQAVSKPIIKGRQLQVENQQLELTIELQPNEIRHLHLIYAH